MMIRGLFFIFIVFLGSCGKEVDLRETTVYFNFQSKNGEKSINAVPGRYVLFAHDEDRLEKSRVIEAGSSVQMTLPNGNWKFIVLGFDGSVAGSTTWPLFVFSPPQGSLYCGSHGYVALDGTPQQIQINVYPFNNTTSSNPCAAASDAPAKTIVAANATIGLCFKWVLPMGDRDSTGDINGAVFKTNLIPADSNKKIQLPLNKNPNLTLPYYLSLEVYKEITAGCDPNAPLEAEIGFDGDITKTPQVSDKISGGAPKNINIHYVNAAGSETIISVSVNID